jgi:hypothetical protein
MSWLDLVGWCGSALLVLSLLQTRVLRFRILNLVASVVLTGFNVSLQIWPLVAMNLVISVINVWHIRKLVGARHDEAAFDVVEVGPNDEYLRHVLRIHEADILAFQPDLVWDGAAPGRLAFLVLHGDETVGVVLVRDDGDGVAQVLLDYVTLRYRDFSPGEFVWRRSARLRERGFHRVVTPAQMVGAYYGKLGLGFELDSATGSWSLDL